MEENNNDQQNNEPVTFTEQQQKAIESLIEKQVSTVSSKHQKEIEALKAQHESEKASAIEAAKKEAGKGVLNDAERNEFKQVLEGEKKATLAERQAREAAETRAKEIEAASAKLQKDIAMRDAILEQDTFAFVDANIVKTLTDKYVHFDADSGTYIVKDDQGAVRKNNTLQPMSLKEFYAEFGTKHPYLVASKAKGGTGAGESTRTLAGGLKQVATKADLPTYKEKSEYIKKFGLAAYEELPLK